MGCLYRITHDGQLWFVGPQAYRSQFHTFEVCAGTVTDVAEENGIHRITYQNRDDETESVAGISSHRIIDERPAKALLGIL